MSFENYFLTQETLMDESVKTRVPKPRMRKLGVLWFVWCDNEEASWGRTPCEAYRNWLTGAN